MDRSVDHLANRCGRTTYGEGAWEIASHCPLPAPVQAEALVANYAQQSTPPECLWVCLSLDLEHIERKQDHLAHANQTASYRQRRCSYAHSKVTNAPSSKRMHDGFSVAPAKGAVERVAVVLGQVVAHERLAAVLVHALQDLVCCRVAEAREE